MSRATPGALIAAVLLPPLGVFLAAGIGRDFWIATALTCLGWLPGIAWSLFVLLRPEPAVALP